MSLAYKACELTNWANASFLDTLAAAYAQAGNFFEALRCQEKALTMSSAWPPSTVARMRERLVLYQNRSAYHEAR